MTRKITIQQGVGLGRGITTGIEDDQYALTDPFYSLGGLRSADYISFAAAPQPEWDPSAVYSTDDPVKRQETRIDGRVLSHFYTANTTIPDYDVWNFDELVYSNPDSNPNHSNGSIPGFDFDIVQYPANATPHVYYRPISGDIQRHADWDVFDSYSDTDRVRYVGTSGSPIYYVANTDIPVYPDWDTDATYRGGPPGDRVLFNGVFYEVQNDVTEPDPWNPTGTYTGATPTTRGDLVEFNGIYYEAVVDIVNTQETPVEALMSGGSGDWRVFDRTPPNDSDWAIYLRDELENPEVDSRWDLYDRELDENPGSTLGQLVWEVYDRDNLENPVVDPFGYWDEFTRELRNDITNPRLQLGMIVFTEENFELDGITPLEGSNEYYKLINIPAGDTTLSVDSDWITIDTLGPNAVHNIDYTDANNDTISGITTITDNNSLLEFSDGTTTLTYTPPEIDYTDGDGNTVSGITTIITNDQASLEFSDGNDILTFTPATDDITTGKNVDGEIQSLLENEQGSSREAEVIVSVPNDGVRLFRTLAFTDSFSDYDGMTITPGFEFDNFRIEPNADPDVALLATTGFPEDVTDPDFNFDVIPVRYAMVLDYYGELSLISKSDVPLGETPSTVVARTGTGRTVTLDHFIVDFVQNSNIGEIEITDFSLIQAQSTADIVLTIGNFTFTEGVDWTVQNSVLNTLNSMAAAINSLELASLSAVADQDTSTLYIGSDRDDISVITLINPNVPTTTAGGFSVTDNTLAPLPIVHRGGFTTDFHTEFGVVAEYDFRFRRYAVAEGGNILSFLESFDNGLDFSNIDTTLPIDANSNPDDDPDFADPFWDSGDYNGPNNITGAELIRSRNELRVFYAAPGDNGVTTDSDWDNFGKPEIIQKFPVRSYIGFNNEELQSNEQAPIVAQIASYRDTGNVLIQSAFVNIGIDRFASPNSNVGLGRIDPSDDNIVFLTRDDMEFLYSFDRPDRAIPVYRTDEDRWEINTGVNSVTDYVYNNLLTYSPGTIVEFGGNLFTNRTDDDFEPYLEWAEYRDYSTGDIVEYHSTGDIKLYYIALNDIPLYDEWSSDISYGPNIDPVKYRRVFYDRIVAGLTIPPSILTPPQQIDFAAEDPNDSIIPFWEIYDRQTLDNPEADSAQWSKVDVFPGGSDAPMWTTLGSGSFSNQTIGIDDSTASPSEIIAPNEDNIVFDFGEHLTVTGTRGSGSNPTTRVTIDAERGIDEYFDTSLYANGDLVWFSDRIYRNTVAIGTGETFTISKWTEISPPGAESLQVDFFDSAWELQIPDDGTRVATLDHNLNLSTTNIANADVLWYEFDRVNNNNIAIPIETTITANQVTGVINDVGVGAFEGHFVLLLSGGISVSGTATTIATRFDRSFTEDLDANNWIIPMGGTDPELSIPATLHGIGTSPIVQVTEVIDPTDPDSASTVTLMPIRISQNGDVVLVVDPGTTFNGNVTIL